MNRTQLIIAITAALLLGGLWTLPADGSYNGPFWQVLFILKMFAAFPCLVVALQGWGSVAYLILRVEGRDKPVKTFSGLYMELATLGLVGMGFCTVSYVLATKIIGVDVLGAWVFLATGWGFFAAFFPRKLAGRVKPILAMTVLQAKQYKWLVGIYGIVLLLCTLNLFRFHAHGDSYLYHLALADNWMTLGDTGVILSNIFSGYALIIEHFYLVLRLVLGGVSEQNAAAQMIHFFVGYGLAVTAAIVVLRRWLDFPAAILFALIVLQSNFSFFPSLPKNDGFVAGACLASLAYLKDSRFRYFYLTAAVAFAIKLTCAFWFGALGVVYLGYSWLIAREVKRPLVVLLTGAAFMVAVWFVGFGFWTWQITGNPLFPFLSTVFATPYAPQFQDILTHMEPFSLTIPIYAGSILTFVLAEPIVIAGAVAAVCLFVKRRRDANADAMGWLITILVVCALAFTVLQLVMGNYTVRFSMRHYLSIHLLMTGLSVAAFMALSQGRPKVRVGLMALLLAWGVGHSHVEVKAAKTFKAMQAGSYLNQLREMKPSFALLERFAHDSQLGSSTEPLPVLDASNIPQRMLVGRLEIHHPTNAYPLFHWLNEDLTGEQWYEKLSEKQICFVLFDRDSRSVGLPALERGRLVMAGETGRYSIHRNPACRKKRG